MSASEVLRDPDQPAGGVRDAPPPLRIEQQQAGPIPKDVTKWTDFKVRFGFLPAFEPLTGTVKGRFRVVEDELRRHRDIVGKLLTCAAIYGQNEGTDADTRQSGAEMQLSIDKNDLKIVHMGVKEFRRWNEAFSPALPSKSETEADTFQVRLSNGASVHVVMRLKTRFPYMAHEAGDPIFQCLSDWDDNDPELVNAGLIARTAWGRPEGDKLLTFCGIVPYRKDQYAAQFKKSAFPAMIEITVALASYRVSQGKAIADEWQDIRAKRIEEITPQDLGLIKTRWYNKLKLREAISQKSGLDAQLRLELENVKFAEAAWLLSKLTTRDLAGLSVDRDGLVQFIETMTGQSSEALIRVYNQKLRDEAVPLVEAGGEDVLIYQHPTHVGGESMGIEDFYDPYRNANWAPRPAFEAVSIYSVSKYQTAAESVLTAFCKPEERAALLAALHKFISEDLIEDGDELIDLSLLEEDRRNIGEPRVVLQIKDFFAAHPPASATPAQPPAPETAAAIDRRDPKSIASPDSDNHKRERDPDDQEAGTHGLRRSQRRKLE